MKRCSGCREEKDEAQFAKSARRKDGRQTYCRECNKRQSSRYYERWTEKHKNNVRERKRKHRESTIRFVLQYLLEHPCIDCGEKNVLVLEFDHRNPKEKNHNVSQMMTDCASIEKLQEEIAKCDVRCANCHRIRTFKQRWPNKMRILSELVATAS